MPILSGFEATKQIRFIEKEHPDCKEAIIYACTAEAIFDNEELIKYNQAGFNDICSHK